MSKTWWIIIAAIFIIAAAIFFLRPTSFSPAVTKIAPTVSPQPQSNNNSNSATSTAIAPASPFSPPLDRSGDRVTKKKFGTYVTPQNSPVQPEKFQGFHTGVDFETFSDEASKDITVHAICSGKLSLKEYASGYGGVAVQNCTLDSNPITVIYGHLKLASISAKVGEDLNAGDSLGLLGKGYSSETDGERKHLHLGIHQGTGVNILGYVQKQSQLSDWIDPCKYVCQN